MSRASHQPQPSAPRAVPALARAALAALTALTLAACAADQSTAPAPGSPPAGRPVADVAALTTGTLLYDQSALSGVWSGGSTPGPAAATPTSLAVDFVVPAGQTWAVSQVLLTGFLETPTLSFSIRADAGGRPGAALRSVTLAPARSAPSACCTEPDARIQDYLFALGVPVTLEPGTYWLAVETRTLDTFYFNWELRSPAVGAWAWVSFDGASWGQISGLELAFALYEGAAHRAQSIAINSTPPSPAVVGGTYAVDAAATSGLTVAVSAGPANVCTASGSTVTFVGVGTCTVTADQAGDLAYDAAPQATQAIAVDYQFAGFAAPVDNGGVLNSAKAGQAIPLKWRLTDAAGAPVTTLTSAAVTVAGLACELGGDADALEAYAAAGSGLQNLGDGYYQLNWKAPGAYAKSCKTLKLDLGEGSGPRTALFQFTR